MLSARASVFDENVQSECDIVSIILVQGFSPLDSVLNDLHNSSDRTQPLPIIAEILEI